MKKTGRVSAPGSPDRNPADTQAAYGGPADRLDGRGRDPARKERTLHASGLPGAASLARRAHQASAALSRAAHFHPCELPPAREELAAWSKVVLEVVEATEREWL
jgi:hypothetical protein